MRSFARTALFALTLCASAAGMAAGPQFDCPPMQYPKEAQRKEWQGTAVATFVAQADGTVVDVRIAQSSGHAVLDLATQESVAGCKVRPQAAEPVVAGRQYRLAFQWKLDGSRVPPAPPQAMRDAAAGGDPSAQYRLAVALMKTAMHGPDMEVPALLEKAARAGHAGAQALLGDMLLLGAGVEKNPARAAELYRKAAEQGSADGQYKLSNLLLAGTGVERDPAQALSWARKAAEQGLAAAQSSLAAQLIPGAGADMREPLAWMDKAAAQGNPLGLYMLGRCHRVGRGVPQDAAKAADLYTRAAAKGYKPAQRELADLLEQGLGVPMDKEKARLLREAANN
jgi:TonB family protein